MRSVELERLIADGQALIERREAFERIRDLAAERYEAETGSAWRPRAGSLVNHKHLTAAMIDSRDFIAARPKADRASAPERPEDRLFRRSRLRRRQADLGRARQGVAKHPDMVLIHGGTPKGAEKAAACWADHRKVTQIAFKPDWTPTARRPFKRNDRMLEIVPVGVIVFPGSGITANLADKVKKPRHPRSRSPGGRRVSAAFLTLYVFEY